MAIRKKGDAIVPCAELPAIIQYWQKKFTTQHFRVQHIASLKHARANHTQLNFGQLARGAKKIYYCIIVPENFNSSCTKAVSVLKLYLCCFCAACELLCRHASR